MFLNGRHINRIGGSCFAHQCFQNIHIDGNTIGAFRQKFREQRLTLGNFLRRDVCRLGFRAGGFDLLQCCSLGIQVLSVVSKCTKRCMSV